MTDKFRVIGVSNFDDEAVSDIYADDVTYIDEAEANKVAEKYQRERGGDFARYFYKAVPADHKLYKWEP